MPSSLAAIACAGTTMVLVSTIVGRSRTRSNTAGKMPESRSAPAGSAPMSASMRGVRDRWRKAQPGMKVILVRISSRLHSAVRLPFHGQTATTSRSGRFSRIAKSMSRKSSAPPPPKLPTFEITITRRTGLAWRAAVIARSRVPTRRKVSAATIARVYVGAFWLQ